MSACLGIRQLIKRFIHSEEITPFSDHPMYYNAKYPDIVGLMTSVRSKMTVNIALQGQILSATKICSV